MKSDSLTLGQFEHEVLMAAFRLKGNAYSNSIKKELKERVGRDSALGTIGVCLSRLQKRGFLTSELGDATERRQGRPKRLYELTGAGATALNELHRRHLSLWDGLGNVGNEAS